MRQKKVPIFSASACGYNVLIFCKVIKTKVDDFKRTFKLNSVAIRFTGPAFCLRKRTLRLHFAFAGISSVRSYFAFADIHSASRIPSLVSVPRTKHLH